MGGYSEERIAREIQTARHHFRANQCLEAFSLLYDLHDKVDDYDKGGVENVIDELAAEQPWAWRFWATRKFIFRKRMLYLACGVAYGCYVYYIATRTE